MKRSSKKWGLWALICLLVVVSLGVAWFKLAAPTKIALYNFPQFQVAGIALSNQDPMIKFEAVDAEEVDRLSKFDFVLGFAMGLKISEAERATIQKLADKGTPIYMSSVTNPQNDICNLDSIHIKAISGYLGSGNKLNYQNMARYIRKEIDKKVLFVKEPQPVVENQSNVFFTSVDDKFFASKETYESYLKSQNKFNEKAGRIAILPGIHDPFSGNREHLNSIISSFENAGYMVYPIACDMDKRVAYLDSIQPDAVIYFPHGRIMMGNGEVTVDWLKKRNIPVFAPLSIMQLREKWEADPMGMFGGFMGQSLVMPELDGAIYPYSLIAQEKDPSGLYLFKAMPERLKTFTEIVSNVISLKQKNNADKKVAIYFFKGPGQASLAAQGLETIPAIYNLLKRMKAEGYNVENLPKSVKEFEKIIMKQGAILSTYAEGAFDTFMKEGNPALVSKADYENWVAKSLTPERYADVISTYGEAPGSYMSTMKDGVPHIAVSRIEFGNIALLPQPMAGLGDDEFAIVHGAKMAPPHTYIASYLWTQHEFKADLMMHFGTHGSLEFTPQKQVALSHQDWPDRLVGSVPHYYYYTIGNIGESMMAKRRSYATTISYLTPAFMESQTRGLFSKLQNRIRDYYKADPEKQEQASIAVKKIAMEMGIHRDLRLDSIATKPYTEEEIERIDNFAEEIANEKMNGMLYTTGVPYESEKISSTVLAMSADPIAYSVANLDRMSGRVTEKELNNRPLFTQRYLEPAKTLVRQILAGKMVDNTLVASVAKINVAEIEQSKQILKPARPMMMGGGGNSSGSMGRPKSSTSGEHAHSKMAKGGHPHAANAEKPAEHPHSKMAKGEHPHAANAEKPAEHPHAKMAKGEHPHAANAEKPAEHRHSKMAKGGHPHAANAEKPAEHPHSAMGMKAEAPTKEARDRARAILEIERTITNIQRYRSALLESPEAELSGIINAFNGGYIAPSSGGDAVANPNAVPTGRNLYSINAENTPSEVAWDRAVALVSSTLEQYKKQHGEYPRKVSYTFWSSEFIESEGTTIGQALYMLGVEPIRDTFGRVSDLRLIPAKDLGRPRIDIVVQTSGQFRDLAASRLMLLSRAVEMAANAEDEGEYENQVKSSTVEIERQLVENGLSPKAARELSTKRVFGGINGMYGTNIQGMITSSDKWESEKEIADVYINNMGAIYSDSKEWGAFQAGLLRSVLHNTDVIVQPRQSNTWGALSLDHVYEFMGGMNLAIRNVTGKDPDAFFADYRNRNRTRMQDLKEAIGVEARTTVLNPVYVKEIMKSGSSAAGGLVEIFTNTFGWNVAKPNVIDKELWDELYNMYIADTQNLGTREFFRTSNPAALQEISAIMLETHRKGMWAASEEQIKTLVEVHKEMVTEFGSSGFGFSAGNKKLQDFISQKLPEQDAAAYRKSLNTMLQSSSDTKVEAKDGIRLQKESSEVMESDNDSSMKTGIIIAAAVVVLFIILIFVLRKRRTKTA
ncbi:hypothetical protein HQ39_03325 [Porphyromonas sp. COT-108 OH2963]|uniref:cobaltochelatase subunit CobN n=1 Tax=Porphyromonas sp. COT-108 OH2963 TaxID=1515614 RepID=UPI00052D2DE2|nr:cobaltochelatase subunit CobN [Porphyromonas sp. COT-108 OH2963]KGN96006.1 hypothetical protein HQ39_03325 [Porphyromonas sp. COT-108 OH2963]